MNPFLAVSEEIGWGILDPLGRWINLLILAGVLIYFLRDPLLNFFGSRRKSIQEEIKEAHQARDEAQGKLEAVEARMKNLDQELAQIREEAEKQAELERQRIIEQAEQDARKIVSVARREMEVLTRAARTELKQYAAQLSVDLAEDQIREEMDAGAERKVIDRFFVKLSDTREGKK
ncbi:MAG: F0F1 ATP synthase subunit B [Acidobacteriota bacterium]